MKTKFVFTFFLTCLAAFKSIAQQQSIYQFTTKESDRTDNVFVQKIPLHTAILPKVRLTETSYEASSITMPDSLLKTTSELKFNIGLERKKPFLMVQIPAFRKNESGQIEHLTKYNIELITAEKKELLNSKNYAKRSSVTNSVLANGTWQKIGVAARGIYKVDYLFVKNTLGITGAISSSSIRLFGNGGTMLYEENAKKRVDDLEENALDMYDGGDGVFGEGDYFLFYANGPTEWVKDSAQQQFHHRTNLYSNLSYYFITFNNGSGLRMSFAPNSGTATTNVNSYNEYAVHEKDLLNLGLFGKVWWGETFGFNSGLTNIQEFNFPLNNISDSVFYTYQLASAAIGSSNAASFNVLLNNNTIATHTNIYGISGTDGEDPGVNIFNKNVAIMPSSGNLKFTFEYTKFVSNAKAYLDYIEINTRRNLLKNNGQHLSFRDWRSVAAGAKAQYTISNATSGLKVWDVTNPLQAAKINGTLVGSNYSFVQDANSLHEFIAANESDYQIPQYIGTVANQNLHALTQADYIIITHPEMMEAAKKLADFHRSNSGLNVVTASVNDVYNEFGSGSADISAIRDFVKMFYDRAGNDESKMPKYLLLLGQASYDYRNIISNTAKLVPTYETPESLSANNGYCSDDFYAILDSNESVNNGITSLLDIGVGRIPATSAEQAMAVVEKIIRYKSNEALGPWRINNLFLGDNEDNAGNHLEDADQMFKAIESTTDIYTAQKVYLDNMKIISTPGGVRCPDANKVINDNMYKGAFLMNYSGHGSIYTLAHERIVTQDDYNSWNNQYKMPIMITATCDFSRFDNPALQSAGEKIMLKNNGGAIALVTTTQVVYATYNRIFNYSYLHTQFTKNAHGWNSFGDAFRISKNVVLASGDVTNSRKFALLGDPALVPNFPRYNVQTDSVNELIGEETVATNSVKSLGRYRFHGSVRDDDGETMTDFNGKVNVTIYDKAQSLSIKTANTSNRNFSTQNNIIYKGIASVQNGTFSFEFITPKDINYDFGKGKVSYYAENGTIDAAGADTSIIVGGFSENAVADNDAPVVRPFMNDSLFKNGGLTGTNSVLFAIITDNSGINVSGNFVGHDLVAILDEQVEVPYVLNDYYETAPNTYQRGYVNFPMTGLTDGIHTLRVKAWDVYNNSGENTITFEVLNGNVVKLRNISTYPNPFRDITHFVFEHNHPNEALKATINIFNTSGALVRTIEQEFTPTGSNTAEITWDGTGNGGEKLFSGVYPFRIRIATEKNIEDLGYQKVVLIR